MGKVTAKRKPKVVKWKKNYEEYIRTLGLAELIELCLSNAQADDYDGCFSPRGSWELKCSVYHLNQWLMHKGIIQRPLDISQLVGIN